MRELAYYDRKGNAISVEKCCELMHDRSYKILQHTEVGKYLVSTVWLGNNHGKDHADPIIFETMLFDAPNTVAFAGFRQDLDMERYTNERDAFEGHERMVHKAEERVRRDKEATSGPSKAACPCCGFNNERK